MTLNTSLDLTPLPNHAALLRQPLPPDAVVGMTWGPFRYRRYPVFSLPWLLRRLLVCAVGVGLYGALVVAAYADTGSTLNDAVMTGLYFTVGFMLMFTVGPVLGTWVRHRGWRPKAEAWGVVVAVILGYAGGYWADKWTTHEMEKIEAPKEVAAHERKIGETDEALLEIAKAGVVFAYFIFGGGVAALAYFSERRRLRARAEHLARLESDMRLAVLQAQIEPHFLFNTLAALRPLIRQDAGQAEVTVDALAEYLRATIPQMRGSDGAVTSTLGQQVDICGNFLAMMQVRMGARLVPEIAVPDELRTAEFPPLVLLSLVENAIHHGIEPKPGPGRLVIRATAEGAALRVSVADDGAGLKDGLSTGLGLANIREQLAVRFAQRASLSVAARPEGGTVAEIVVPLVKQKA